MRGAGAARAVAYLCSLRDVRFASRVSASGVPTGWTHANFSASQGFVAKEARWYAMHENPNDASVFIVGGEPTRPGACRGVNIGRTVALRIAGGAFCTGFA